MCKAASFGRARERDLVASGIWHLACSPRRPSGLVWRQMWKVFGEMRLGLAGREGGGGMGSGVDVCYKESVKSFLPLGLAGFWRGEINVRWMTVATAVSSCGPDRAGRIWVSFFTFASPVANGTLNCIFSTPHPRSHEKVGIHTPAGIVLNCVVLLT